ncbi:ATP-binding protein [Brevundimonas guildfordensis]|uniref:histidine kinase n=1 Tax=Brevundimonas guildfordensis TaxID=2762241 RepID=A0ABR8R2W5_9CAUL|nr:ATP-binding protein [Brevundimonas guildfordensis]MBD7941812.1 response regulator [Brevundimonas guildfordensis]
MSEPIADAHLGWAPAIRQRRKATMQRLVMGGTTALVFSPLLGLPACLGWLAVYFVIQALEAWLAEPVMRGLLETPRGWRGPALDAVIALNASFFGLLSVPLWLVGGPMGGFAAAVLLSAGTVNSVIMSAGNLRVFGFTVLPQLGYLALTPMFMARWGAEKSLITAVSIGVIFYALFCFNTRSRLRKAMVAERHALAEAERERRQVETAMVERSAFMAAIGHDLRTPISAILTGADYLRSTVPNSAGRQQVALIEDAGLMMKALLDDLLDHSRLNAGRMHVESHDFDLRLMLAQTARLWQGHARAQGLQLRLEGARETPRWVHGDAMRLRQVLNNLISNAMKFTNAGTVTLRVRSWLNDEGSYALLIEVADTGRGMSAEQLERLFTPFDQTQDGVAARFGGSGLGLAISRDLIILMGGRLTVRSEPGGGSQFTVALSLSQGQPEAGADIPEELITPLAVPGRLDPLAPLPDDLPAAAAYPHQPAPAPEGVTAEDEDEAADSRPLRVLVVDDHAINRRAIQLILQAFDCEIVMAENGLAALEACEGQAFDVIFMDVRMPELDGRETTRRLRKGGGPNARVPVIAVTADTEPEDMRACLASGMNAFVSKPLTPAALLDALTQTLDAAAQSEANSDAEAAA